MFVQLVIAVWCAFCVYTAVLSFLKPVAFGNALGLQPSKPDGTNEIRAQYGGFFLAVAIAQGAALTGSLSKEAALTLLTALFGGLIAGRFASLLISGRFSDYGSTIRLLFAIDTVGFLSAGVALTQTWRG